MVRTADKILGALGLARRAGALAVGFDAVQGAVKRPKGEKPLVLLAADASEGTAKRIRAACENGCRVYAIPHTQQQLLAVCQKPTAVLAVINKDLAALCEKAIREATGEEEPY